MTTFKERVQTALQDKSLTTDEQKAVLGCLELIMGLWIEGDNLPDIFAESVGIKEAEIIRDAIDEEGYPRTRRN